MDKIDNTEIIQPSNRFGNNRMQIIRMDDANEFIRELNENKVTDEFLESCRKAGELFRGKSKINDVNVK